MAKDKAGVVMGEFKRGKLKSGSGGKVKNRKQAIAIALSEQRKQGGKMPSYYNSKSSKPKKTKVKKYQGGGTLSRGQQGMLRQAQELAATSGQNPARLQALTAQHGNLYNQGQQRRAQSQMAGNQPGRSAMRGIGPGMKGGGSVNQLIDKKYKHGGKITHNPSTINP
jgi:hypothetical protein